MESDPVSFALVSLHAGVDVVGLGVSFEVILTLDIQGLPTTTTASTSVNAAACPFELPMNSS